MSANIREVISRPTMITSSVRASGKSGKTRSEYIFRWLRFVGTILDWLYGDLPDSKLESLRKARAQNSGSWFLRHPLFESWVHGESSSNILFCPGIRRPLSFCLF